MAINRILVSYDGSEFSQNALRLARDIAISNSSTTVDIVYVVPIPLLSETQAVDFKSITDLMMEDGKNILQKAYDEVSDLDDRVKTLLLTGTSPATEILKMAHTGDYDLIAIGSRGLGGIQEYLGSVSHKVFHGTNIPVLVAK